MPARRRAKGAHPDGKELAVIGPADLLASLSEKLGDPTQS
jgi:hypothetical protein